MVYSARKKFGIKGFAAILTLGACLSIPVGRYRREFHFREGRHREPILRYRYRNGCTRENHSPRFSDFRLLRQAPRLAPRLKIAGSAEIAFASAISGCALAPGIAKVAGSAAAIISGEGNTWVRPS